MRSGYKTASRLIGHESNPPNPSTPDSFSLPRRTLDATNQSQFCWYQTAGTALYLRLFVRFERIHWWCCWFLPLNQHWILSYASFGARYDGCRFSGSLNLSILCLEYERTVLPATIVSVWCWMFRILVNIADGSYFIHTQLRLSLTFLWPVARVFASIRGSNFYWHLHLLRIFEQFRLNY